MIYPNVRTLTKPANVSPFINGIKKLLDENTTLETVAVKV
jgi:hypothetical protein